MAEARRLRRTGLTDADMFRLRGAGTSVHFVKRSLVEMQFAAGKSALEAGAGAV